MGLHIEDRGYYKYIKIDEKRLDLFTVPTFKEEMDFIIQSERDNNIMMDLKNCTYCDTSGLSFIMKLICRFKKAGGKLVLTGVSANIRKLIQLFLPVGVWNKAKGIDKYEILLNRRMIENICYRNSYKAI